MISLPRTSLVALCCVTAWIGACAFSTGGLPGATTSSSSSSSGSTGGQGGNLFTGSTGGAGGATSSTSATSATSVTSSTASTTSSTGTGGSCPTGQKLCGSTCVNMDVMHGCSGTACTPCDATNATAQCDMTTGLCAVKMCDAGWADCNNDPSDGCEVHTVNDTSNCGMCGKVCMTNHATQVCMMGKCMPTCDQGYGDCDTKPANGCETRTDNDIANCGACGRACSNKNVLSLSCTGGLCDSSCTLGFGNCMKPPTGADDGCEKATTDGANCGGCGNTCNNPQLAHALMCAPTTQTAGSCGCTNNNQCTFGGNTAPTCDTSTGLCSCHGNPCNPGETCKDPNGMSGQNGDVCTCNGNAACQPGESCCASGCHDLSSDTQNCIACGRACPPGFICYGGGCSCNGDGSVCNAGAPAGTFSCPGNNGPDVCVCSGTMCAEGQRCQPNGQCG